MPGIIKKLELLKPQDKEFVINFVKNLNLAAKYRSEYEQEQKGRKYGERQKRTTAE
jgi:hypothetical protein